MWRDEWDSTLKDNYNVTGGMSAAKLAERFGTTKGVVIRRARTLGIAVDRHDAKAGRQQRRPIRPDHVVAYGGVAPVVPIANPPVPAKRTQLPQFTPRPSSPFKDCQWIDGDSSGNKCGCPTALGSSWCGDHLSRVFVQRATDRKSP